MFSVYIFLCYILLFSTTYHKYHALNWEHPRHLLYYLQQCSDMTSTRFLIPHPYSQTVESYIETVKLDLGKTSGRLWFTGRHKFMVPLPMGKNTIGKVPQDAACWLELENLPYFCILCGWSGLVESFSCKLFSR